MRAALLVFIKSGVSFCIGMTALWAIFAHAKLRVVFPELVGGSAVFGLLMAWLSVRSASRYTGTSDVSKTRVKRSLTLPLIPSAATEVVRRTLGNLAGVQARSISVEDGLVVVKTGRTRKSYGEVVSVSIRSAGESESALEIMSVPIIATTIVDQGKNRQNVDEIYEALLVEASP